MAAESDRGDVRAGDVRLNGMTLTKECIRHLCEYDLGRMTPQILNLNFATHIFVWSHVESVPQIMHA